MSKIVHIGFGKTGSSKLQKDIFPQICRDYNLEYYGDAYKKNQSESKYHNLLTNHVAKMELGFECENLNISDKVLISAEELSSYRNAEYIEEFAEKNLIAFGKDTHIILTIREPKSWLSSIYLQLCAHEKPMQNPEHFFLNNKNYSERLPNVKFNIDKFSYNKVIDVYKIRFDKLTVIKYEHLKEANFLKEIFNLNDNEIIKYKKLFAKRIVNRGFSEFSYKISSKLQGILYKFGLSFRNKYSNAVYIQRASDDFKKQNNKSNKKAKVFKIFHYKFIFQTLIDNIISYKKYNLDFSKLKFIDIQKFENEYNQLPNVKTYISDK